MRLTPSRAWQVALATVPLLILLPLAGTMTASASGSASNSGCQLGNGIRHVVYVQFDNVHLTRDTASVPSDLEQMPNLKNFLQDNGTLSDNQHTPLIAHTANDILTSLTGLYGDQQGQPIANYYLQYPNVPGFGPSSFQYWTRQTANGSYNNLTSSGANTPAPWVPFTRAGCNVGAIAQANIGLEGTSDVAGIYGAGSPEAQEVASHNPNAYSDFVGIAVHCAKSAALCASTNRGVADVLPQEPHGYSGFNGLFGAKYVDPQIGGASLTDLNGNPITGFPGYDGMDAATSLGYTAAMQEHGVAVTYSYISSAHVDANGNDAGPGQADYVNRLKAYDSAWGKFFAQLKSHGISKSNTLFVITADENDIFAGGTGSPAGCDGVHTPCTYSQVGEITTNLRQLMQQAGSSTPFALHSDTAPGVYLVGQPGATASSVRAFEKTLAGVTVTNPISGATEKLINFQADPAGLGLLHMISGDPARTPTFVAFGKPQYYMSTSPAPCSATAAVIECPTSFGMDAWMHGDLAPRINTTWLGLVGPGVRHLGRTSKVWSDHSDIRSTILVLAGLKDDYVHEGRAITEFLSSWAVPEALRSSSALRLGVALKQINAPVGTLSLAGVTISTAALSGDDETYASLEEALTDITAQRNALASQMISLLEGAAFSGKPINEDRADQLVSQSNDLVERAQELAGGGAE